MSVSDNYSDTSNYSSESDTESNNEEDKDDIVTCINEFTKILEITNVALSKLDTIKRKYNGPTLELDGKCKLFSEWLTEWEDEMKHDTIHNITWGEFIIEKLVNCTEID
jgi:hypothetical protein